MASRTLSSERDRKMTIMLTPFMSCSAKLPIYAFFTAAFFPGKGAIVMIGLYFFGILMGILAIYPLSSSIERKKNSVTMIGRKLSTLPTP